MYPITFEVAVEQRVGDFEITNLSVYAVSNGDVVTEVPAGKSFEIHAEYSIRNYNPGWTNWTTCMTVYDVTHAQPVGSDEYGNHFGGGPLSAHDAVNAVMPSEPTTFRVKISANQEAFAGCPPSAEW